MLTIRRRARSVDYTADFLRTDFPPSIECKSLCTIRLEHAVMHGQDKKKMNPSSAGARKIVIGPFAAAGCSHHHRARGCILCKTFNRVFHIGLPASCCCFHP